MNDYAGYIAPALTDPKALRYLSGIGLQYPGLGMIAAIRNETATKRPDLKLWETETPCGGGRASVCGNGPGTHNNSWQWGEGQWQYMRSFIESGVSLCSQWNMVLDETGKSGWNWSQCSPVTVFKAAQTVSYEGSYWATKHYSYFVEPGAKVLLVSGGGACRTVNGACGCARGCTTADSRGGGEGGRPISSSPSRIQRAAAVANWCASDSSRNTSLFFHGKIGPVCCAAKATLLKMRTGAGDRRAELRHQRAASAAVGGRQRSAQRDVAGSLVLDICDTIDCTAAVSSVRGGGHLLLFHAFQPLVIRSSRA